MWLANIVGSVIIGIILANIVTMAIKQAYPNNTESVLFIVIFCVSGVTLFSSSFLYILEKIYKRLPEPPKEKESPEKSTAG